MKRYKLIKEYPGSPKLNTVVDLEKSVNGQIVQGKWCYDIDKTPEYWQEVVEKDYEILSFKTSSYFYHLKEDNKYRAYTSDIGHSLDFLLKSDLFKIHSVKRLSDSEIFTIGDHISVNEKNNIYVIDSFKVFENLRINAFRPVRKQGSFHGFITNLKHVKQPLFTTEDGVDIYFGNKFWRLKFDGLTELQVTNLKYELDFLKDGSKLFSTKQKAIDHIEFTSKRISKQDIFNIIHKGFDRVNASALGKHKVLAMFDIGTLPSEQQKLFTIEDINSILDKHFQKWNSSTMIDRQVLLGLLKQK